MSRSALVDPRTVTPVAVRPSTALVVTDAKRQLATVATIKVDAERQHRVITRNRGGYARESSLQVVARALHRTHIPLKDGPPVAGLAGLLAALRPMINRYEAASGAERTALRGVLAGWLQEMDAKKALSPEARQELERVTKATEPSDAVERDRLASMKAIVLEVQHQGELDVDGLNRLKGLIAQVAEHERPGMTLAVVSMVRESGRVLSYEAVHALHQMEQGASVASER